MLAHGFGGEGISIAPEQDASSLHVQISIEAAPWTVFRPYFHGTMPVFFVGISIYSHCMSCGQYASEIGYILLSKAVFGRSPATFASPWWE